METEVAYHLMQILYAARKSSCHSRKPTESILCASFICVNFYYLLVNEFVKSYKNVNSPKRSEKLFVYSNLCSKFDFVVCWEASS